MRSLGVWLIGLVFSLGACQPKVGAERLEAPHRGPDPAASDAKDAGGGPQPGADDAAVAAAAREYVDLLVRLSPEDATALGLHDRDTELDPRTPEAFERGLEEEEAFLASLRTRFEHASLSPAARTDLTILLGTLAADIRLKREQKPLERRPDLYASPLEAIFAMSAREYAPAATRANAILARMEKIPAVLEDARKNLKSPPRVWTLVGIDRAKGAESFFDEVRAFLESALPADKARIGKAIRTAKDAYAAYASFLEKKILPRSSGSFAAGKELFDFLLREQYALDQDSEQLLAIGKAVFERTGAQMDEVAKRIDPNARGWRDVTEKVKANHPTADDLVPAYRREVERARAFLVEKDVVPFPPDDDCRVIETPPFLRSTTIAAYDQAPPFDPTTKGFFFVTPIDRSLPKAQQEEILRENDHGDIVNTSVHEAYPGHHLQLSFARRHPSLIRKVTGPSISTEGWALYSEELMSELGYYTDEERLMQLEWTLLRAARVIIDVGLHTKGMTFEQAVALLTDQVHLARELAIREVKRYTLYPTQPLSYLIGREMFFRIRERYKAQRGAAFSLKAFHTDVLTRGTIAPGLLEREMFEEGAKTW